MVNVFAPQIFFIVFRETLEAAVVVSVLLAFLKQGLGKATDDPLVYKKLVRQVWVGSILGVVICLILGCAFIGAFYSLGNDIWGKSEDLWEGIFSVIATVLITAMGLAMLRINKMKEKWRVKIAKAIIESKNVKKGHVGFGYYTRKYAMFLLPFITTLREGLEAVVFVGGVGLSYPASAFPIPVIVGLIAGIFVGAVLYYGGSTSSLQIFLVVSTCILYLIAAGLWSRAIWYFQTYVFNTKSGGDASESGSGNGSYNIKQAVWHVNCCNPETDNGWDVFNALLGWQNTGTYGSVISYNIYWLFIIVVLYLMWYQEKNGHFPFLKSKVKKPVAPWKRSNLTKEEEADYVRRVEQGEIYDEDADKNIPLEDHTSSDDNSATRK